MTHDGQDNAEAPATARRDERELVRRDALRTHERLDSLVRMAEGVAHTYNNLLTVVLTSVDLAETTIAEGLDAGELTADFAAHLREHLVPIARAASEGGELGSKMLAFGRGTAAGSSTVNVNELLDPAARRIAEAYGDRVRLQIDPAPDLPPVVANRDELGQTLIHLVVNACEAMPDGGELSLGTEEILRDTPTDAGLSGTLPPGRYVHLRVSDTGLGLSSDALLHTFEPFFTTKPDPGAGLGLAAVHGIVARAGGVVMIESTPGLGTTIDVLLPAAEPADRDGTGAPTATPRETTASGTPGTTILVVDDEPGIRDVVTKILTRAGYEVLVAADGHSALELAGRHPGRIDLLLTDVTMPGMSGPELARTLTIARPAIRVMFMSGYAESPAGKGGEPEGPVVLKPFNRTELVEAVRGVLATV